MDTDIDIMIDVEFGADLLIRILDKGGVRAWNRFVVNLKDLLPGFWASGETPPLVNVGFDFSGLQVACRNLDGIDLWLCQLEGANFDGTGLRGARIGCCPNASFQYARLTGAIFCDISGCDFTGAELDGIVLTDVTYDESRPPVGLPPELLSLCKPDIFEDFPFEIPRYVPARLDCGASMNFIPKEG